MSDLLEIGAAPSGFAASSSISNPFASDAYGEKEKGISLLTPPTDSSYGDTPQEDIEEGSPNATDSEFRVCRICTDKSDGAHFGVDSCRACAAFFRRSIVLKKKYVCRQGGNACNINKSVRCMCRKCRFVKCLQAGMLPENVHQRPAAAGSTSALMPGASHAAAPSSSFTFSDTASTSSTPSHSSIHNPFGGPSQSVVRPTAVRPPPTGAPETFELLQRIFTNYTQMTALRQSSELTLIPTTSLRTIFGGANGELRPCNFDLLNRIMKAAVPIIADFCNQTFPQFAAFTQDEKWALFRNFIGVLFHFECGYRSTKNIPGNIRRRQITVTTYLDFANYDKFFTDCDPPVEVQPSIIKLVQERSESPLAKRLHATFMRLALSDMELAAFVGLTLWSPNMDKTTEAVHEVCVAAREAIFRDLHNYYRSGMMMDEYSVRLGEFMSLFSNLQATTQKMREEMELFSLFDVFEKDSFVYHLLKQ